MDSDDAWVRHQAYEKFLGGLADGGWFSASMELSAVRDISFEGVMIGERDVIVDIVSVYSFREQLDERDYEDWQARIREDLDETCGLLISEKAPSQRLAQRLQMEDRIGSESVTGGTFQPSGLLVVVDLSEEVVDAHARDILKRAYERLKSAVDGATQPRIGPASTPRRE